MRAIFTAIGILCVLGVLWWILFRGATEQVREPAIGASPAHRGMRAAAQGEHLGSKELEPAAGERGREREVQVRSPAETEAIAGIVVDDAGNPVAKAKIGYEPMSVGSRGRTIHSGKDGTFRVQRHDQSTMDPVVITASHDAYESGKTESRHAWGATDAKVVLRRGLAVEVVVRDGDRDEPLERYGVRCVKHGTDELGSDRGKLREPGAHPGGILRLTGVLRGRHLLIIEPEGPEWQPSLPRIFEVTDQGAPQQDITVWRPIKKTVRVKTAAGAPFAFTHVELVRQVGERPVDEFVRAVPIANLQSFSESFVAQLISKGATARDGTVELFAPPRETLFLRVLGPGHPPVVREVTIDPTGGDLEIVVPKGAILVGAIHPPELVRQLAEDADRRRRWGKHGIQLRRAEGRHEKFPLDVDIVGFVSDGTFRVEGIPPGSWDIFLSKDEPLSGQSSWERIGRVYLADGDERNETFDLSRLLKVKAVDLRSNVLKLRLLGSDGVTPASKARLVVKFADSGRQVRAEPTDEQGRAEIYGLPAGDVTIQVWPKRSADAVLVNVATITISPPETSKTITLPASTEY